MSQTSTADVHASVILAHGAWADGSSWSKVITRLRSHGVRVRAAALPLSSPQDDLAALERTLDRTEGPVVLVGHAYAGAVIGATRNERVAGLVYVAALAPDEGETVADVYYRDQPHPRAPELAPDDDGYIWLPDAAFPDAFAQDATDEERDLLASVQRPIAGACIASPVGRPLWRDRPSWYFVAERDRMIPAGTQRFMAGRMNAHVRSGPTDHAPLVTAPGAVTELILEAVRALGPDRQALVP
ncbi:alpha/beta fold hydrolase [Streptomyces liangshanensis]|uniref:Alpha/beta hydrolase n=1 Tax=Streptomyces liangshanensis TaxID=2717324 RepID=A0A6G9H7C5_9ACTN|nr:alpha/beta hydrolase [Streptomyces liangshanensis]QIQ06445.1 alpha/beta hydrolase [Streptomyces liangshanensis]